MTTARKQKVRISKPALGLAEFVALMAFMTSLVALSIDAMLPALAQIGEALGTEDPQHTHLIISLFFFGMAFGQLYYGPLSDARGRRYAILSGLIVFALGTVICMLAETMTTILVGRVIQAFGVSGPRIAALAVIRDQYAGEAMARVMSFIMMVFILVPMIAPIVGQAVLAFASWQHIFTLFLLVALIIGVWYFARQPETLPADRRLPFSWSQLRRSSLYILTHKPVMYYTLAMGFIFGAFLAYLSASQTIFQHIYSTGDWFPAYFALLAFSIGFASFVNGSLVMRLGMAKLCDWALLGVLVFALLLTVFAWHFDGLPPLGYFVTVLFCMFFCVGILFGNLNAMAMQPLGEMAGLGAAIIGSLSSLFSVPIAIFVSGFIEKTITPVAYGFVFFAILAMYFVKRANRQVELEHRMKV